MKLRVILAKDTPNEEGLPDIWPVLCNEINDDVVVELPNLEMTLDEYNSYRTLHQDKYDVWKEALVLRMKKEKDDKEAAIKVKKDALMTKLGITQEEFDLLTK